MVESHEIRTGLTRACGRCTRDGVVNQPPGYRAAFPVDARLYACVWLDDVSSPGLRVESPETRAEGSSGGEAIDLRREQLLYPTWTECDDDDDACETTRPPDEELTRALRAVRLEKVRAVRVVYGQSRDPLCGQCLWGVYGRGSAPVVLARTA